MLKTDCFGFLGDIMKRLVSLLLVLIISLSIVFQCSFTSSAVFGVDDAILIGTLTYDLISLGVTFNNVQSFVASDFYRYFAQSIAADIDQGISLVKRNGQLFFATAAITWNNIVNWVKSKFSGLRNETKEIPFDVTTSSTPLTLTLKDGTVVPFESWMYNPMYIFGATSTKYAYYCTNNTAGARFLRTSTQIVCKGTGKVGCYRLDPGASQWTLVLLNDMLTGHVYQGVAGSAYNVNYSSSAQMANEANILYRTIERITDTTTGTIDTSAPPAETIPDEDVTETKTVSMSSDATYYPGKVASNGVIIREGDYINTGDKVLIKVPDELIVDENTPDPTITTDSDVIIETITNTTIESVKPKVLTKASSNSVTVEQVISDTPVLELDATGNAQTDIETANKFRLPQSFLEGFPFSIPYSIYVGIQSLVGDPAAPQFTFPFSIPRIGIYENISVDLSEWSSLAYVCRALLSLVWVAGLAIACSRFIKR